MRLYELLDGTNLPKKKIKRCKWKGCRTILADKNFNPYCFAHLSSGLERDFKKLDKAVNSKPYPAERKKQKNRRVCRYEEKIVKV